MAVDDPAFGANPFGLFHMHGNVWEWVEDRWHDRYDQAPSDGSPWLEGSDPHGVVRGGSWIVDPGYARSAFRIRFEPGDRLGDLGFRVARTLTP